MRKILESWYLVADLMMIFLLSIDHVACLLLTLLLLASTYHVLSTGFKRGVLPLRFG